MASTSSVTGPTVGLIILGNSGVGKSLLGNILLDGEAFTHRFSARPVTSKAKYMEFRMGNTVYAVVNTPSVIADDPKRGRKYRREIHRAFRTWPTSLIFFVFGQQNGRIREEDAIAFNALNKAYRFQLDSVAFIVNDLTNPRPRDYEKDVRAQLQRLTKTPCRSVCFLNAIEPWDATERKALCQQLLQVIDERTPSTNCKQEDIEVEIIDGIAAKEQVKAMHADLQEHKKRCEKQIRQQKAAHEKQVAKMREDNLDLRRYIERRWDEVRVEPNTIQRRGNSQGYSSDDSNATRWTRSTRTKPASRKPRAQSGSPAPTGRQTPIPGLPDGNERNFERRARREEIARMPKYPEQLDCGGVACRRCGRCRDWYDSSTGRLDGKVQRARRLAMQGERFEKRRDAKCRLDSLYGNLHVCQCDADDDARL